MINTKELKIEVGVKGYETYIGKNSSMGVEEHRHGVYAEHMVTGDKIYINLCRSQIMNKEIAIKILEDKDSCLMSFNKLRE